MHYVHNKNVYKHRVIQKLHVNIKKDPAVYTVKEQLQSVNMYRWVQSTL